MMQGILSPILVSDFAVEANPFGPRRAEANAVGMARGLSRGGREKKETDPLRVVHAHVDILRQLSVFDGSWIQIADSRCEDQKYAARIFAKDESDETDGVLVPEPLLFNMRIRGGKKSRVHRVSLFSSPSRLSVPKPCVEAHISRVNSPDSSGYASYSRALRRHFAVDRVLRKGDIFAVSVSKSDNVEDDEDADMSSSDDDSDDGSERKWSRVIRRARRTRKRVAFVYFRVTRLESRRGTSSDQCLVVSMRSTKLVQNGSLPCPVPSSEQTAGFVSTSRHGLPTSSGPPVAPTERARLRKLLMPTVNGTAASLVLLSGSRGSGKRRLVREVGNELGLHVVECVALQVIQSTAMELQRRRAQSKRTQNLSDTSIGRLFRDAATYAPCVVHLRRLPEESLIRAGTVGAGLDVVESVLIDALRRVLSRAGRTPSVAVVGSTDDVHLLSTSLRGCFVHEVSLSAPSVKFRRDVIKHYARNADDVVLDHAASETAGRCVSDLRAVVATATARMLDRDEEDDSSSLSSERRFDLSSDDIRDAVTKVEAPSSMGIDQPKIPKIFWKDVGGLEHAKKEIQELIELPLKRPELFALSGGGGRSGILLYGPPGTGKTLLAKAVATECDLNFMSVKGPELLNMYVGESERNVREVFQAARDARPCVLFFDELDSLAPARGRGADGGGVMDRVVSQFLSELDGLGVAEEDSDSESSRSRALFVIGATNRPDLLDPALLRPGRFDRLVYLGISADRKEQKKIVKALTRKFNLAIDVDMDRLVAQCPRSFTGADFYAVCSTALMTAIKRHVKSAAAAAEEKGDTSSDERTDNNESGVEVCHADFMTALRAVTPSVSADEIRHYRRLKAKFSPNSR